MNPADLLTAARNSIVGFGTGRPLQATLRRAVSTIYYAAFTCLANTCADKVVGQYRRLDNSGKRAWVQVYRAVEHGKVKNRCKNNGFMGQFPPAIRDFAALFVDLQYDRTIAAYVPYENFFKSEVEILADTAEQIIQRFIGLPSGVLRAFAVYVLFDSRKN